MDIRSLIYSYLESKSVITDFVVDIIQFDEVHCADCSACIKLPPPCKSVYFVSADQCKQRVPEDLSGGLYNMVGGLHKPPLNEVTSVASSFSKKGMNRILF